MYTVPHAYFVQEFDEVGCVEFTVVGFGRAHWQPSRKEAQSREA